MVVNVTQLKVFLFPVAWNYALKLWDGVGWNPIRKRRKHKKAMIILDNRK